MATLAPLAVSYDAEEDILYVRLRHSDVQPPRTEEADHGVLIDRDPTTKDVVGIEILDFLGHFAVLKDLSWLAPAGISSDILSFLRQKAQELQQQLTAASPPWDNQTHS